MSTETAFEKDGIRRLTQLAQFAQVGLGVEGGHLRCFESIRVDLTARQWRGSAPEHPREPRLRDGQSCRFNGNCGGSSSWLFGADPGLNQPQHRTPISKASQIPRPFAVSMQQAAHSSVNLLDPLVHKQLRTVFASPIAEKLEILWLAGSHRTDPIHQTESAFPAFSRRLHIFRDDGEIRRSTGLGTCREIGDDHCRAGMEHARDTPHPGSVQILDSSQDRTGPQIYDDTVLRMASKTKR